MNLNMMIDEILRREGGYVDHKNDRGGATNFGVTQTTLEDYLGRQVSKDDVRNMSRNLAKEIYENNYYYKPKINQLPDEIQGFCFDCAINHGPSRAIKFVQTVCKVQLGRNIDVDGAIGPETVRSASELLEKEGDDFLACLVNERKQFYRKIVERDPSQEVFLTGWLNRANEFLC